MNVKRPAGENDLAAFPPLDNCVAALYGWDCTWPLEKCDETQGTGKQSRSVTPKGTGCREQKNTTALAKKACNEQTKSILGKKASVGPERSSASSPRTCQSAGPKPSKRPQRNTGPMEDSSAQRATLGSPARLDFFQRKPSPAGHFLAPPALTCFFVSQPCRFQGRRQTAPSSMGTGCWKKRSLRHYRLLCRLKTANAVMLRCLRHVLHQRQKVIECSHMKEKARGNGKKRSTFSSSPHNSSQHVSPADWQHARQWYK